MKFLSPARRCDPELLSPAGAQCQRNMTLQKSFAHSKKPSVQVEFFRCETCGLADLVQSPTSSPSCKPRL